MQDGEYHLGQRLSLKSQLCTVRYVGPVDGKVGEWLGVEWDDTQRGKHDGTRDGRKYFSCRSRSKTAASFLKPTQAWDESRTFLQALTDKYFKVEEASSNESIYVSRSKQFEEVGFDKFAQRQSELRGIHTVVLDRMKISGHLPVEDEDIISRTCSHIRDLDIGSNTFEHLVEILSLVSCFPSLRRLTLDGNHLSNFSVDSATLIFPDITDLSLNATLLAEDDVVSILRHFPAVQTLELTHNELQRSASNSLPASLNSVDLSENDIRALTDVASIIKLQSVTKLKIKNNAIASVRSASIDELPPLSESLVELDLGFNQITEWRFFDELPQALPALRNLRVSGNPLHSSLTAATGKPLTAEDGYMLTIARLPQVTTLNFSTIREKDRLNAEKYYLSEIAVEVSRAPADQARAILANHPRWQALCEEYGEPAINYEQANTIDPNSLAARLVAVELHTIGSSLPAKSWTLEVPRACNIYVLYGLVAKDLALMPINLRLTWETGERDPVSINNEYNGPEWWDSSDDESEGQHQTIYTTREVRLVPSTRPIGTYFEGPRASVRVEQVVS